MTKRKELSSVILATMLSLTIANTAVVNNQPVYASSKTSQSKVLSTTAYTVKAKVTRLRSKPSDSGVIIRTLMKGDEVSVIGKKGSWSQVRYKGNNNNWVKTKDIKKKPKAKYKKRVLTANVVLLATPKSNGKVITTLRKGSTVFELSTSGAWVKVEDGHYSGYVNKRFLK